MNAITGSKGELSMVKDNRKKADALILVGVSVLVLMICLSWSFRASNIIAGAFNMDDVQICEELDEDLRPIRADKNMPADSQQVCLWFHYSKARRGDSIEISWYLNERAIQKETVRLSETSGTRAFYLLKEDGALLDSGFYSVFINCNGREKGELNFTVAATSEDFPAGNVVIWD
ncbi:MAG: hypothetical protein LBT23_03640 [Synergistaceae bacterium]|jgi:hypothetical protein|nr:hypothetical protein [Synergistaceae bacterium]